MNKANQKEKIKWLFFLSVATLSFMLALLTQKIIFNLVAIVVAVYIYKNGNPILFKEYDEKKRMQYKETQKIREAVKEIISSNRIVKK